jgi:hypothetical protein
MRYGEMKVIEWERSMSTNRERGGWGGGGAGRWVEVEEVEGGVPELYSGPSPDWSAGATAGCEL